MHDLIAAVCLMVILEGLLLFAAPEAWRRMVQQISSMPTRQLRGAGAIAVGMGLLALWWVRA
ncbi:DUF2065 domain-containing protein [Xanthomonas sp. A2111]|uniref:DUF2065 domain-containing protein n=1 Tax=Xanthomonas hawaiiensis TaxID=3003247 RepID=A0ABU2I7M1_9XANT|nr:MULTISPECIES: DUF2065 domain-containing protein [unclassified Xanthomonas]MBO9827781.1 DUF2065 domain-containing protein [Xanthomonas sp. A2111]MBO9872195.1 DUF2065 domain-containing protein [Xanthomonas sp. D-93]MDS9994129.1 DUF2065 domain-containing protein [Xanthomonas sp. A2111]WNH45852.1 DUF2065 domain-containing protein [Xanthomonas sp. A6251]